MFKQAVPFGPLVVLAFGVSAQETLQSGLKLSGYYKSLLEESETIVPGGQRYLLDLNRLRLQSQGKPSEYVVVDLQYDSKSLFGSCLHTAQFTSQSSLTPDQYLDLDGNYLRGGSYYGQYRLYRGNATLSSGDTNVRTGWQRTIWGTGRFWSPLDLSNPLNSTAIEREERVGVDAVLAEHKLGPVSRTSAVYASGHGGADSSTAFNRCADTHGMDYSIVGGHFGNEQVIGFGLAGQTGTAGICGESTQVHAKTGSTYQRAALVLDYASANTFTLSAGLYHNGTGTTNTAACSLTLLLTGKIRSVTKHYTGGYMSCEITPLFKREGYAVVNLDDHSRFASPLLTYSIKTNFGWQIGAQFFMGSSSSEFGHFYRIHYTQIRWLF